MPSVVSPSKRQREFRGRNQRPCRNCSTAHLKCDGYVPCIRCTKKKVVCSYEQSKDQRPLVLTQAPHGSKSWNGGEVLFGNKYIAFSRNAGFWIRGLVPASQRYEVVLLALKAHASIHGMAKSETYKQGLAPKAIEWYCSSLEKPPSQHNTTLLLMTATIYTCIESDLGHHKNVDNLLRSAFAIINVRKPLLTEQDLMDDTLFYTIRALFWVASIYVSACPCVPKAHWDAATALVLQMNAMRKHNEFALVISQFEIYTIMQDIDTNPTDWSIELRLIRWLVNAEKAGVSPAWIRSFPKVIRVVWYYQRWRLYDHEKDLISCQTQLGLTLDSIIDGAAKVDPTARWALEYVDEILVRTFVFVAWYWREPSIFPRMKASLTRLAEAMDPVYIHKVLTYLEILLNMEHGQNTALERKVFGEKPLQVLLLWQAVRLAYALVDSETIITPENVQVSVESND